MDWQIVYKFKNIVRSTLKCYLCKSGAVLYSSYHTLKPGRIYILGLNPGGDPWSDILRGRTIENDLEDLKKLCENYSEYTQKWGKYECGKHPLQKSIRFLVEDVFNLDVTRVCASNLIFLRTKKQPNLRDKYWEYIANKHWKIHKFMIEEVVRPQIIISFGVETFYFILNKINKLHTSGVKLIPAHWGKWKIRALINQSYLNKPLLIFGFPHLSRYRLIPSSDNPSASREREKSVKQELLKTLSENLK